MDAIEFNEKNLPKILQCDRLSVTEAQGLTNVFIERDYVFIRGFYGDRIPLQPWAIIPKFIFANDFDYDPVKIKTDWDQIVWLQA